MAAKRKTARKTAKKKSTNKKTATKTARAKSKAKSKSKSSLKKVPAGGSGVVYLDPLREALARRFAKGR